jgi:hypothetical protein
MPPKRKRKDGGAVGDSTSVTPRFKRRKEVDTDVNVILGMTGSVASIKAGELITRLAHLAGPRYPSLKVVATKAAKHFFNWEELKKDYCHHPRLGFTRTRKSGATGRRLAILCFTSSCDDGRIFWSSHRARQTRSPNWRMDCATISYLA